MPCEIIPPPCVFSTYLCNVPTTLKVQNKKRSSIKVHGLCWCTAIFKSSAALGVCLGSLSCWKFSGPVWILQQAETVFLKICSGFSAIHLSFKLDQFSSLCWWKASLQHDADTTMFHCGNGFLRAMGNVGVVCHIIYPMMAKMLSFSLVWPWTFFHGFWVSDTCFYFLSFKHFFLFVCFRVFPGHSFINPWSVEGMAWCDPVDRYFHLFHLQIIVAPLVLYFWFRGLWVLVSDLLLLGL